MEQQLPLPEIEENHDEHAAALQRQEWYLDEAAREVSRRGVAAARQALEQARQRASEGSRAA